MPVNIIIPMLPLWLVTENNRWGRKIQKRWMKWGYKNVLKIKLKNWSRIGKVARRKWLEENGRRGKQQMKDRAGLQVWGICLITLSCWSGSFWALTLNVLFSCPQSHNPLIWVDFSTLKSQAIVLCETVYGRAVMVVCLELREQTPGEQRRQKGGGHEVIGVAWMKWKEAEANWNKKIWPRMTV